MKKRFNQHLKYSILMIAACAALVWLANYIENCKRKQNIIYAK